MKKTVYIIVAALIFVCAFTSCQKKKEESPSSVSENSSYWTESSTQQSSAVNQTESAAPITTETKAPLKTEPQDENKVVTYISENPDNPYICRVAEQYGSDKANLIAFIKKNSKTPGATVLEFSGKRDSNGDLIVTAEELRYVYDVSDGKSIKRASSDGKNNDGYNKVVAKAAFALGEKFLLPNIDEMRAERRYEDYFTD